MEENIEMEYGGLIKQKRDHAQNLTNRENVRNDWSTRNSGRTDNLQLVARNRLSSGDLV